MDILKKLAEEFKLNAWQVENTVKLIDEGNTTLYFALQKRSHR